MGGCIGIHLELHLSCEQVGHRRRRAAVGNMGDSDAGASQQQFHRYMRQRAIAGGGVVELAWIVPGIGDKAGKVGKRRRRMAHQQFRNLGDNRNRRKVFLGIVGGLRAERGIDRVVGCRQQERVAVGGGLGSSVGGNDAAGAGFVLDHEGAAEFFRHARRHEARHVIDRAAGGKRQNEPDRSLRILRLAWAGSRQ